MAMARRFIIWIVPKIVVSMLGFYAEDKFR